VLKGPDNYMCMMMAV